MFDFVNDIIKHSSFELFRITKLLHIVQRLLLWITELLHITQGKMHVDNKTVTCVYERRIYKKRNL